MRRKSARHDALGERRLAAGRVKGALIWGRASSAQGVVTARRTFPDHLAVDPEIGSAVSALVA